MTIVYCDWATGDDTTGDGSAGNPYKTITKASTGLTGGDEVRVAKSPEPTALTGTLSFTNGSTAVTGSGTAFTTQLAIGDFIRGGDGNWWEVVTITSDTAAKLYQKYSGSTESGVSSQKLGITDTGEAAAYNTQVQAVSSSGTSSANLKISGGWDLATESQTGQSWFKQMHTTFANRLGYGLYLNQRQFTEVSRLHFLRYNVGIYYAWGNSNNCNSPTCNSCQNYGIILDDSRNNILTSPVCNMNKQGIYINSSACKNLIISPTCNSNSEQGIYFYNNPTNNILVSPTCKSNGQYAIYQISAGATHIYGTLTTSGNANGIYVNIGNVYIDKANMSETNKFNTLLTFCNPRVSIGDMGGQSYIYTDGGNIVSQAATAGGTGKEWKFSVTSANRGANYHLDQEIARVLVAANKQVTVKLYFKKSHASNIKAGLFMRGKQIAGVDNDILQECPADTNRNQVTLTFTPTEAGVVSIEAHAWYVSSTTDYVIVDDIDITQAA